MLRVCFYSLWYIVQMLNSWSIMVTYCVLDLLSLNYEILRNYGHVSLERIGF